MSRHQPGGQRGRVTTGGTAGAGLTRVAVLNLEFLAEQGLSTVLSAGGLDVLVLGLDMADPVRQLVDADVHAAVVAVPGAPDVELHGATLVLRLRRELPTVGLVVLARQMRPDEARDFIRAGRGGFAYLDATSVGSQQELVGVIEQVAAGRTVVDPRLVTWLLDDQPPSDEPTSLNGLTPRERDVLRLMAAGHNNSAIAEQLGISLRAVEKHVTSIFLHLGLTDDRAISRRVAAVLHYLRSSAP